ncbi:MAG: gliding motility lipoprotein GldD [Bacteroidales bacterium]|nr:gliding motility lipoprotein GldD [Bacteroidales bacterium]MCF8390305.1 gliding motility lipoprotein GldD [Bacteroidales bacterium]
MKKTILIALSFLLLYSCNSDYTPKPRGYMKIDFPKKNYIQFNEGAPFSFAYPDYARIVADTSDNAEPWWYNILFPSFDATIYLSYKKVNNNVNEFIEDSRTLAFKHSIKAESIDESLIYLPERNLYGIIYDLKGNTASSLQFFLTDSSKNFLRGSLYFNTSPEKDSLAPIVSFIRLDLEELINSFQWN